MIDERYDKVKTPKNETNGLPNSMISLLISRLKDDTEMKLRWDGWKIELCKTT